MEDQYSAIISIGAALVLYLLLAAFATMYDTYADKSQSGHLSVALRTAKDAQSDNFGRTPDYVFLGIKNRRGCEEFWYVVRQHIWIAPWTRRTLTSYSRFFRFTTLWIAFYTPCGVVVWFYENKSEDGNGWDVTDAIWVGGMVTIMTGGAATIINAILFRCLTQMERNYRTYVDSYAQGSDVGGLDFQTFVIDGHPAQLSKTAASFLPAPSVSTEIVTHVRFPSYVRWPCLAFAWIAYAAAGVSCWYRTTNYTTTFQAYRFGAAWGAALVIHIVGFEPLRLVMVGLQSMSSSAPSKNPLYGVQYRMFAMQGGLGMNSPVPPPDRFRDSLENGPVPKVGGPTHVEMERPYRGCGGIHFRCQ